MSTLSKQLTLDRCPHCNVDTPSLGQVFLHSTQNHAGQNPRIWGIYQCARCGGLVIAAATQQNGKVKEVYPASRIVDDAIPIKAKAYLEQALSSLHAPAGAIMLAASAVDAMLKEKKYTIGSLYERIDQAAQAKAITDDMAKWAHKVRLDANDQRHADEAAALPTEPEAKMTVDFALALGEFMFVLPARIQKGLAPSTT